MGKFKAQTIPVEALFKSWSFSRFSDWRDCPLKAKLKHLDKVTEPPNEAMSRGSDIHTMAEKYITGALPKLPDELKPLAPEFKKMRDLYKKKTHPVYVEDSWAFTQDWEITQWNDWARCWVRIKLDCAHHIVADELCVTDWKTGNMSPYKVEEYMEQLSLYALGALLMYDYINKVYVRLGFTDQGAFYPPEPIFYERSDLKKLLKEWNDKVKPMMADRKFAPKPNRGCTWCWYGQSKKAAGGPGLCKF